MHVIRRWWHRRRLLARLRRVRQRYHRLTIQRDQMMDDLHKAYQDLVYYRARRFEYAARIYPQCNRITMLAHEAQSLTDAMDEQRRQEVRLYLKLAHV